MSEYLVLDSPLLDSHTDNQNGKYFLSFVGWKDPMIRYGMNASRSEVTAVPRGQHSTFTALLFPAPHHVPVTLQVPEVAQDLCS